MCTTLNTDVTAVKACLTDPSATGCTTTYSATTTLPSKVANMDKCMTSIEVKINAFIENLVQCMTL